MTVEEALEYFLTDREIHQMWNTAFDIATDALEKQIPREPKKSGNGSLQEVVTNFCPICGVVISKTFDRRYCGNCGQKIDWSEDNDN